MNFSLSRVLDHRSYARRMEIRCWYSSPGRMEFPGEFPLRVSQLALENTTIVFIGVITIRLILCQF